MRPLSSSVARALTLALTALLGACAREGPPPNLLLISVDTLRPDRLGCYGHERETSPTIDALAAAGVVFEDVTSASPWTLPSHASLLTGRYASRHGVKDHSQRLSAAIPTLATLLAQRGYQTLAVVNSHLLSERYGLDRGFQRLEYVSEFRAQGGIPNRGALVVDTAIEVLEARSRQPFFLFLHFYDVHTDLTPAPEHRRRFTRPYAGTFNGLTGQLMDLRAAGTPLAADDAAHLLDLYDAEIRTLDDVLAGLLSWFEREQLLAQTLVVLTSDHGEEFGEHGSVLHGRTYFEEVIRIPLVVRGPGVPAGRRVAGPVHLVDVAPTLLGAAGAELPSGLDGIDLRPLWATPAAAVPDRLLFAEADFKNAELDIRRMVRAPDHKLIYDRLVDETRLYDLRLDPLERQDLSAQESALTELLFSSLQAYLTGSTEAEVIGAPDQEIQDRLRELGY